LSQGPFCEFCNLTGQTIPSISRFLKKSQYTKRVFTPAPRNQLSDHHDPPTSHALCFVSSFTSTILPSVSCPSLQPKPVYKAPQLSAHLQLYIPLRFLPHTILQSFFNRMHLSSFNQTYLSSFFTYSRNVYFH
jgi:hypothetical protein